MGIAGTGITAPSHVPLPALIAAPAHWRHVDFISDLHLQASEPATFDAWQYFMQNTQADAVFILGDLFEVWVGDDVLHGSAPDNAGSFETRCAQVLQAASRRLDIFFMHGNRDFLLGPAFAKASGMTLLVDPCVLEFAGQRWLLSHGDALCLQDTDYMLFRKQVRQAQWQVDFLRQPMARRQTVARALREQSEARRRGELANAMTLADLDSAATRDWLRASGASTLIHGHTHRPGQHDLSDDLQRIVLSDWDCDASPARAEVLRLSVDVSKQPVGVRVQRLAPALA
jgi:UDP-2,3-diacylglucosamine hydrolase